MYMKYIVIDSGWYTMGRDYLLNETGESFLILDPQPYKLKTFKTGVNKFLVNSLFS